jgi:hypothetical protein
MKTLSGYQRAVLVSRWIKQKPGMTLEQYIKKVCKAKGITYRAGKKEN